MRMPAITPAKAFLIQASIVLAICGPSDLAAQQRPTLGYVFPPGSPPGRTVDVQLGGYDLTPDTQFLILDERVKLEIVSPPGPILYPGPPHWFGPRALNSYKPYYLAREATARLKIPSDMPAGVIHWQVANANGASDRGAFVIGDATPEATEQALAIESDGVRTMPTIPIVINGCLSKKEQVDRFRWTADRSGLVTLELPVDCLSERFDGVLQIEDAEGNLLLDIADPAHRGISQTVAVTKGTQYTLSLFDLDYRGDRSMVYRLSMRYGPRIVAMLPPTIPANATTPVRLFGYGLRSGQPQLESITIDIDGRADDFDYAVQTEHGPAGTVSVSTSPLEWILAGNDRIDAKSPGSETAGELTPAELTPAELTPVDLPARFADRLDIDSGYGFHRINGKQGDAWSIDLRPVGRSPISAPALSIIDTTGKTLLYIADESGEGYVRGTWTIPQDGQFMIAIGDLSSSDGVTDDRFYQLRIEPLKPDFQLITPDKIESLVGADEVKVGKTRRRGQQQIGVLGLDIDRIDGFDGEIKISLEGLPQGANCPEEMTIAAKATGLDIPIRCDASMPATGAWIDVIAEAIPAEAIPAEAIPAEAIPAEAIPAETASPLRKTARLWLAPIMAPPVVITPKYPDGARTVNRGATYPAPVMIQRSEGFSGPVELQMAAVPDRVRQGIYGDPVSVPAEVEEAIFPLVIPEWVQTDRTSRIILNSVVQVPDASGTIRHLVNRMKQRITMNVEGALLKINEHPVPYVMQSERVEIPITIFRSGELSGPVRIELEPQTDDASMQFVAEAIVLQPHETEGRITIRGRDEKPISGEYTLTLLASGSRDGYAVLSRAEAIVLIDPNRTASR